MQGILKLLRKVFRVSCRRPAAGRRVAPPDPEGGKAVDQLLCGRTWEIFCPSQLFPIDLGCTSSGRLDLPSTRFCPPRPDKMAKSKLRMALAAEKGVDFKKLKEKKKHKENVKRKEAAQQARGAESEEDEDDSESGEEVDASQDEDEEEDEAGNGVCAVQNIRLIDIYLTKPHR